MSSKRLYGRSNSAIKKLLILSNYQPLDHRVTRTQKLHTFNALAFRTNQHLCKPNGSTKDDQEHGDGFHFSRRALDVRDLHRRPHPHPVPKSFNFANPTLSHARCYFSSTCWKAMKGDCRRSCSRKKFSVLTRDCSARSSSGPLVARETRGASNHAPSKLS